ncbi:MAG: STAS/SEC14 domain-containing protein [Ramlibacter sp.]
MPFSISVEHAPEFLLVKGSGPALLGDMCGLMDLVRLSATSQGHRRALLDLLEVQIDFKFTDHLALGNHTADQLRELERVASVVAERFRVGTSEKAAQKMGARLKTFTSMDEALAWLRSP